MNTEVKALNFNSFQRKLLAIHQAISIFYLKIPNWSDLESLYNFKQDPQPQCNCLLSPAVLLFCLPHSLPETHGLLRHLVTCVEPPWITSRLCQYILKFLPIRSFLWIPDTTNSTTWVTHSIKSFELLCPSFMFSPPHSESICASKFAAIQPCAVYS